jgi:hypothetical protein
MQTLTQATPMPVERRFPLELQKFDDDIRALYETAKKARWNPDTDLPSASTPLRWAPRGGSGAAAPGSSSPA